MARTRLICVGACAIDTILTVPHFPDEDSKLRATSFSRRRGGNTANTLEVIQQLLDLDDHSALGTGTGTQSIEEVERPELFLIAALPAEASVDVATIASSFRQPSASNAVAAAKDDHDSIQDSGVSRVDLSRCIYRQSFTEAVSSYVISSQATSSRTIVNHNALPEMTFDEFVISTQSLVQPTSIDGRSKVEQIWLHFEGRIPSIILECIRYLRSHPALQRDERLACSLKISVEIERPGRDGLQELARAADVVFYSKAWAKDMGYENAEVCLNKQAEILVSGEADGCAIPELLVCTWGDRGASALSLDATAPPSGRVASTSNVMGEVVHSPAVIFKDRSIVDSTGAGDTFNAGMLYGLICRTAVSPLKARRWNIKQMLDFANGLAGRKILQEGFSGLGELVRGLRDALDEQIQ